MVKGDIVLIPFPFTDLTGTKLRPALILASSKFDITVCFITSQTHNAESTDVHLQASLTNGLKVDSIVRTSKIDTLERSLAKGLLGDLTTQEITLIEQSLKTYFSFSNSVWRNLPRPFPKPAFPPHSNRLYAFYSLLSAI